MRFLYSVLLLALVSYGPAHAAAEEEASPPPGDDTSGGIEVQLDRKTNTITVQSAEQARLVALNAAERLIKQNRLDDAQSVLLQLDKVFPKDSQVEFLMGMVALNRKDYTQAEGYFRQILVREPKATRVRLELARAYFLQSDDENAKYHFRFAMAGDLPPAVRSNIDSYLNAIRRRRNWDFGMSFGIAPDTNLNTAPTIRDITIFGLPFELSDDAQAKSGVGVFFNANGEYREPFSDWLQGRVGARVTRNEYKGGDFDDMTLSGFAGPRVLIGPWDVSFLATGYRRWYGNQPYSDAVGARIEADRNLTARASIKGSIEAMNLDYATNDAQDGVLWSLSFSGTYGLTPSSFVRGLVFGSIENATQPTSSNQSFGGGFGYYQDLPYGFSIYAQPTGGYTWYDGENYAFGALRREWLTQVRLNLLNRKLDLGGFTPLIGYVFQWQKSNIELYKFKRHRFEIGFTRQF